MPGLFFSAAVVVRTWGELRCYYCLRSTVCFSLDAVVVGAPVGDGLLDLFAVEVFGYGALGEGGYFGVGGEAQAYELVDGEGLDEA